MKIYVMTSLLSIVAIGVLGCTPPNRPKFSTMDCISNDVGVSCRFKCNSWTNMIGQPVITCEKLNEWDAPSPICHPDYSKCPKINDRRCPKITKSDIRKFREHRDLLTKQQLEAIQRIQLSYNSYRMIRSTRKRFCVADMCMVHCPTLRSRRLANMCRKCRQKVLRCGKSGSILG